MLWIVRYIFPNPETETESDDEFFGPFDTEDNADKWVSYMQTEQGFKGNFVIVELSNPRDLI